MDVVDRELNESGKSDSMSRRREMGIPDIAKASERFITNRRFLQQKNWQILSGHVSTETEGWEAPLHVRSDSML
jgi:hypothetical protein